MSDYPQKPQSGYTIAAAPYGSPGNTGSSGPPGYVGQDGGYYPSAPYPSQHGVQPHNGQQNGQPQMSFSYAHPNTGYYPQPGVPGQPTQGGYQSTATPSYMQTPQQYGQTPPQQTANYTEQGVNYAQAGQQVQYGGAIPMATPVVMLNGGVGGAGYNAPSEATKTAAANTLHSLRCTATAMVVISVLGVCISFAFLVNILSLIAGALTLCNLRDINEIFRLGQTGTSARSHPAHAFNIAIAALVFCCITCVYSIPLAIGNVRVAFGNERPADCHGFASDDDYMDCVDRAHTGGAKYVAIMWVFAAIISIIQGVMQLVFMSRYNALAIAAGPGLKQGACCGGSIVSMMPRQQTTIIMAAPHSFMPQTQISYVQPAPAVRTGHGV